MLCCHSQHRTQKNKATNAHLGLLKAKLAKLRAQVVSEGQSHHAASCTAKLILLSMTSLSTDLLRLDFSVSQGNEGFRSQTMHKNSDCHMSDYSGCARASLFFPSLVEVLVMMFELQVRREASAVAVTSLTCGVSKIQCC